MKSFEVAFDAVVVLLILFELLVGSQSDAAVQTLELEEYKRTINFVPANKTNANASGKLNAALKRRGVACTSKILKSKGSPQGAAISGENYRWKNLLIFIDTEFDYSEKSVILESLIELRQHICIPLKLLKSRANPPSSSNVDYIYIQAGGKGSGCNSHVGKRGKEQVINLETPGCIYGEIVIHEIMHALGYWHEQSRDDRDEFVTILTQNVIPDRLHNFQKAEGTLTFGLPYDQNSILHYPDTAFSIDDSRRTIVSKNGKPVGNSGRLTTTDISKLKIITGCHSPPSCQRSCSGITPYFNTAPGIEFDLKTLSNSNLTTCCAQCRRFNGCKAFVFNSRTNNCYLKKQDEPRHFEPGAVETISGIPKSAILPEAPACHGMMEGLDIAPGAGNDIAQIKCNSLNDCCRHCTSNSACKGFVYSKERQSCFLKKGNTPWVETFRKTDVSGLPGKIPANIFKNSCI